MRRILWQIWTIARHSIVQAIRMRTVAILLVFLIVTTVALPFIVKGDRTFTGQIRIVITYTMFVIGFLLSVLTVFLSSITLNTEIKYQHIFLMDPKPISRGVILLGKWLGVMIINVVLLAVMLGATYGFVRYLCQRWEGKMDAEIAQQTERLPRIKTESSRQAAEAYLNALRVQRATAPPMVLAAHSTAQPDLPPLDEDIERIIAEKKANKEMPKQHDEQWVRRQLRMELSRSAWRVEPFDAPQVWKLKGLPTDADVLVVQFRHYGERAVSPSYEIPGAFAINPNGQPTLRHNGVFKVGTPHQFSIPGSMVQPDGTMEIGYANLDGMLSEDGTQVARRSASRFPFEDGIRVFYPSSTLAWNFARSGVVILMKLAFLAIVGIAASSVLSFPVAVMVTLVALIASQSCGFMITTFLPPEKFRVLGTEEVPPWAPTEPVTKVLRMVLIGFLNIWPPFERYATVDSLASGQLISGWLVLKALFYIVFVRGLPVAALGWYLFHQRELAAISSNT